MVALYTLLLWNIRHAELLKATLLQPSVSNFCAVSSNQREPVWATNGHLGKLRECTFSYCV